MAAKINMAILKLDDNKCHKNKIPTIGNDEVLKNLMSKGYCVVDCSRRTFCAVLKPKDYYKIFVSGAYLEQNLVKERTHWCYKSNNEVKDAMESKYGKIMIEVVWSKRKKSIRLTRGNNWDLRAGDNHTLRYTRLSDEDYQMPSCYLPSKSTSLTTSSTGTKTGDALING